MANNTIETIECDKLAGLRIKELRISKGWSREQLGKKIGVTHQQLAKYESATNRISVGRLQVIAKALGKPVPYFINDGQVHNDKHSHLHIEIVRNLSKLPFVEQAAYGHLIRIAAGA